MRREEAAMIYTAMTKRAMNLAYRAHEGQVDKGGMPYILHPVHVAEQMTDEISTTVALLHDVLEDTDVTEDTLRNEGFPEEVIEAVVVLTRDKNTPYMEYIRHVRTNETARRVKLADLRHNLDTSRLDVIDACVRAHVKRYGEALRLLQEPEREEADEAAGA